ncbi:hypothetical protein DIPPA_21436 [Diplonema papillatum]|nr:hypothetical protein DIPPA_21436 [Diplonema papillatum]
MVGPCLLALRVAAVALTVTVDVQPLQISLGQSAGARVGFTGDAAACNLTVGMSASDDIWALTIRPPTTAQFRTGAILHEGEYARSHF